MIPQILNINKMLKEGMLGIFPSDIETHLNFKTKFLLILRLIGVSLMWGEIRADAFARQNSASNVVGVGFGLQLLFVFLCSIPVFFAARKSRQSLLWILGASITACSLSTTSMPYINECTNLIFILAALMLVTMKKLSFRQVNKHLVIKLFAAYFFVCLTSVLINQLIGGGVFQLKAGIAQLILYFAFGMVLVAFVTSKLLEKEFLVTLIDGYAWGAFVQLLIMPIAMLVLFQMPLLPQTFTENLENTARTNSASGLQNIGLFFAISLPLLIWTVANKNNRILQYILVGYLCVIPWFLMFDVSHQVTLMIVGALLFCMLQQNLRIYAFPILISCLLSYSLSQSFPTQVHTVGNKIEKIFLDAHFSAKTNLNVNGITSLKVDSDAFSSDGAKLLPLIKSESLNSINEQKDSAKQDNLGISQFLENEPTLIEVKGMDLKLDTQIDSQFASIQKLKTAPQESIALNYLGGVSSSENSQSVLSSKNISASFIQAPFINKIVGFGLGANGYNAAIAPIHAAKILLEAGIGGILMIGAAISVLLVSLWKKSKNKDGQGKGIFFVVMVSLAVTTITALSFKMENWNFSLILCLIAVLASIVSIQKSNYQSS